MMVRRLLAGAALALILGAQTPGSPAFEEAVALFEDKDYAGALEIARPMAEGGNAQAMAMLGAAYQSGLGVDRDLKSAVSWYEKAVAAGHSGAGLQLSTLYLSPESGVTDLARGKALLETAALAGNVQAQHNMGLLAAQEIPPDWAAALSWFGKSAEAGYAESQYNLGLLYKEGKGGDPDNAKAAHWFAKAAVQGRADAALDYGVMVFRGEGVQKDEKIGGQWLLIAARRGNPVAQNRIARLLATGRGLEMDTVEAMKWNILASKGGRLDPWLDEFAAKQPEATRKDAEARALAFVPEGGAKP